MLLGQHSLVKKPDNEYIVVALAIVDNVTSMAIAAIDPARSFVSKLRSHIGMRGKQIKGFLDPCHIGGCLRIAECGNAVPHD